MTNEELDQARYDEAVRIFDGQVTIGVIAARLAREGWTPPLEPVDPDLIEAREIVAGLYDVSWPERANSIRVGDQDHNVENVSALAAIKRGRAFAAAEAKPGRWSSWNGAPSSPVCDNDWVCVIYDDQSQAVGRAGDRGWEEVSSYLPIPKPEDAA